MHASKLKKKTLGRRTAPAHLALSIEFERFVRAVLTISHGLLQTLFFSARCFKSIQIKEKRFNRERFANRHSEWFEARGRGNLTFGRVEKGVRRERVSIFRSLRKGETARDKIRFTPRRAHLTHPLCRPPNPPHTLSMVLSSTPCPSLARESR
jgi:hypothetical protein